jgi:hypothetical protein
VQSRHRDRRTPTARPRDRTPLARTHFHLGSDVAEHGGHQHAVFAHLAAGEYLGARGDRSSTHCGTIAVVFGDQCRDVDLLVERFTDDETFNERDERVEEAFADFSLHIDALSRDASTARVAEAGDRDLLGRGLDVASASMMTGALFPSSSHSSSRCARWRCPSRHRVSR